ncbi:MAG TPA: hypothetical protein DD624_06940 [Alphaproteobacteria bacterium]|nr:hypothetical protein [Alphaproteobacteria bacterium]
MSVLAEAFNPKNAEHSFLSRVFSSPIMRGSYKDELPEIDLVLTGSKSEKKRLTHLINVIAKNSPTGKKVLEDAAKAGYSVGFELLANSCGTCSKEDKTILLNPCMNDAKLTTTFAHEARHAQQDMRGIDSHFCTYDIATELRLRRAKEADAQAVALQTALEIRAATHNGSAFKAFKEAYPPIVADVPLYSADKPLEKVLADRNMNMSIAFRGWFDQQDLVSAYEHGYLKAHLESVDGKDETEQLHIFAQRPFRGHMTSEQIVKQVCETENGDCYLKTDLHVLDNPKMCGIAYETKDAADRFFQRRLKLTEQTKDYSYQQLPSRGSLSDCSRSSDCGRSFDLKKTALLNKIYQNKAR